MAWRSSSQTARQRVRHVPGAVFWGLVALVLLSPLPLGSNRPWAWFLLATSVGVLLTLWSGGMLLARQAQPLATSQFRVPLLLFGAACLWALVQWMPWTPSSWHHPLWADARRVLGQNLPGRISVTPKCPRA